MHLSNERTAPASENTPLWQLKQYCLLVVQPISCSVTIKAYVHACSLSPRSLTAGGLNSVSISLCTQMAAKRMSPCSGLNKRLKQYGREVTAEHTTGAQSMGWHLLASRNINVRALRNCLSIALFYSKHECDHWNDAKRHFYYIWNGGQGGCKIPSLLYIEVQLFSIHSPHWLRIFSVNLANICKNCISVGCSIFWVTFY